MFERACAGLPPPPPPAAAAGAGERAALEEESFECGVTLRRGLSEEEVKRIEADWTGWSYSTLSVLDPKTFPWTYGETEQCYVTKGGAKVTPDGSDEVIVLEEGVLATFPKGMSCTWEVPDRIEKKFIFE